MPSCCFLTLPVHRAQERLGKRLPVANSYIIHECWTRQNTFPQNMQCAEQSRLQRLRWLRDSDGLRPPTERPPLVCPARKFFRRWGQRLRGGVADSPEAVMGRRPGSDFRSCQLHASSSWGKLRETRRSSSLPRSTHISRGRGRCFVLCSSQLQRRQIWLNIRRRM